MTKQLHILNQDDLNLFGTIVDAFPNNEGVDLEYKSAKGGFPFDFWKSYAAFANSMGGHIILGAKEKKGKIEIEGLDYEVISSYKKIFWDGANNRNTISVNLLHEEDVKVLDFGNKQLLVFRIPVANRIQKPVFLTRNPFENTYKRNHEGDYRCTREEVTRMIADADSKIHHDSRILEGFSVRDMDMESLKKYRQLFANTKPSHPWLSLTDIEFLEKLGGYRKDRVSKKEGFTVAALLMFGKSEAITDPECVPCFFPDFREILSTEEEKRWTDRIYPDGTWEANLLNFYLKVWPKLSSSLPKPFHLEEGVRKDETPAHVALRESFINALIHTDYSAPGNIVIEHRKENFIFSNPGTLLVSLYQYYQGGISECRNPYLQKMFLMIGSAEKAGSGVNKIMAGWEYAHWRRPYLRIDQQPDRLVLELPMFSMIPEETREYLRKVFGPEVVLLGKDRLTILATAHIEGEISNNRLQYLLDMHKTDITGILQELCRSEHLISENKGRWTTYHLNENPKVESPKVESPKVESPKVESPKVESPKVERDQNSVKQRIKKEELFEQILSSCKDNYLTAEQIASKVGKDVKYLLNKVLPILLKQEKLERLYPNIKHPNQAYTAKKTIK